MKPPIAKWESWLLSVLRIVTAFMFVEHGPVDVAAVSRERLKLEARTGVEPI